MAIYPMGWAHQDNISQQELKGMRLTHPRPHMEKRKLWRRSWLIILVIHHTGQPIPSSWNQWTQRRIGEMFPLYLCHHEPHRNFLNRQQSLKRGRGICKEEGKEEDRTGGEGIIISITWTIINNSKLKEEL